MVTSVEIQNLSFCNKFFSRLYAMLWKKIEKNLKELLTNAHPYNTINNVDDEMHTYVPCKQRCDSCANFVVAKSSFKCFATKRVYKVRRSKNVIYIAFCLNCLKHRVGSTVDWKPRFRNYKSHIKKKVRSCSIVNHFIDVCSDTDDPSRNIRFIIIDQLNNIYKQSLPWWHWQSIVTKRKILDFNACHHT